MGPEGSTYLGMLSEAHTEHRQTQVTTGCLYVAKRLRMCVRGGHSKAKGISSAIGLALYTSIDPSYQGLLDNSIASGDLKFEQNDGTAVTDKEHAASAENIITS